MSLRRLSLSILVACAVTFSSSSLPPPISRAKDAVNGLLQYFFRVENGSAKFVPKAKGCPCYSCDGSVCRPPECTWCSAKVDDTCPTKTTPGCYTPKSEACTCDRLPGPVPPNSSSPAAFFFACGQIGGLGPRGRSGSYSSCVCELDWPFCCTNCYRWWSAVALEAAVNYLIESKMPLNDSFAAHIVYVAESTWIHSPYNADWDVVKTPVYMDDFAWYSIAYLRVYDLTNDTVWRDRAAALHDWIWKYGYDHRRQNGSTNECGGLWWSTDNTKHFKDSITIVEVLHSAAKLANPAVNVIDHSRFLDPAVEIWNWIFAFDNGRGLFASNGIMSTGASPEWCCSPTSAANVSLGHKCVNSRVPGMSYNHGLLMSSAAILYNITGKSDYLTRGLALLDAAYENLTNSDGAVRDLQRGSRSLVTSPSECGAYSGDPGSDFFSFKGIFITHLNYFAQTLRESAALKSDALAKVRSIVTNSSNNVWTKSRAGPPFNGTTDACGSAPKNASYSKYHWWWTTSNVSIETPPNPYLWFDKKGLSCTYDLNSSFIFWNGTASSKDECQSRCANETYSNCTKFQFKTNDEVGVDGSCPCFACDGTPCDHCVYCLPQGKKACPTKKSHGCYTTAKVGCNCDTPPQIPNCVLYKQIPWSGFDRKKGASCAVPSYQYTVVAKRPLSPTNASTSCKGRCDNNTSTAKNGSCFCDAACARHMDCCLDYVDECVSADQQTATCLGKCTAKPRPIRGGGYCFCDSGCTNTFTDNNSYGGCCADYLWRCEGGPRDQTCFDARTQTQAVSVFVAHHAVDSLDRS